VDFEFTPEQDALADSVKRFVEREYDFEKRKATVRSPQGLDAAHWSIFAELGWLGAGIAFDAGGFGGGAIENAVISQELGRALVTEPFVSHVMVTQLLVSLDTPKAVELVGQLVIGEQRGTIAVQEPGAGGDFLRIFSQVAPVGQGWALTGEKSLTEGVIQADFVIVPAKVGDEFALFLVDTNAEGISRRDYRTIDNRRVSDLRFDGVALLADALLARGHEARSAYERAVDHGLVTIGAEALGIMDSALWATRDYIKTRKQFGVTLNNFQALQHRMADMLIEVELTRSLLFHALGAVESGEESERRAATSALKVQLTKGSMIVGQQAIQLHGGIGVTEELIISHYYRRLFAITRQLGDSDLHLARFVDASDRLAGKMSAN
jgi:alkylation response protein AidB-like acyl-CoA dehydrogenase